MPGLDDMSRKGDETEEDYHTPLPPSGGPGKYYGNKDHDHGAGKASLNEPDRIGGELREVTPEKQLIQGREYPECVGFNEPLDKYTKDAI